MPLELGVIEPICVSRGTLPLDTHGNLSISIPNELECVTNGTLANIIRQLSSLSKYAEDLFSGILADSTLLINRGTSLQGRIERLSLKVTQLDSSVEEVSLHDIHLKKPFRSSNAYDQQVISRNSMPIAIAEKYENCDRPPPLDKLNPYRDDGKDGLKFYTDPNYFFELWRQEMLRETKASKNKPQLAKGQNGPGSGDKNRHRKPRQPANTRERIRQMVPQQEFLHPSKMANGNVYTGNEHNQVYDYHYASQQAQMINHHNPQQQQQDQYGVITQRPNSLELNQYAMDGYYINQQQQPPPSYFPNTDTAGYMSQANHHQSSHPQMQQQYLPMSPPNHMAANTPPPPYTQIISHDMGNYNNANNGNGNNLSQNQSTPTRRLGGSIAGRPSQPPPAPPSNPASSSSSSNGGTPTIGTPSRSRGTSLNRDILPPPPPPPPPPSTLVNGGGSLAGGDMIDNGDMPLPPPQTRTSPVKSTSNNISSSNGIPSTNDQKYPAPAPPPPPPPLPGTFDMANNSNSDKNHLPTTTTNVKQSSSSLAQEIAQKQQQLKPAKLSTLNKVLPQLSTQVGDTRSDLLAAIREGIKLKRVEDSRQKEVEKATPCNDVASILARRIAMELSDSDSNDAASDGSESDGWDDESEC